MVIPKDLDALESKLLNCEQIDCSLTHHFAPDVYIREGLMPKGALIIGHAHKRKHLKDEFGLQAIKYALEELLVDKSDLYLEKEASLIESKIEEAILCL